MKKLLFIALTAFAIIVTGCSENNNDSANGAASTENAANTEVSNSSETSTEENAAPEGSIALKEQSVMSGLASIKIPEEFTIMSDEMKQIKYPNGNAPAEVYTNEDGTINVAMNQTGSPLNEEDLEAFTEEMAATYQPIATEWIEDGVVEINGMKAGHLSFVVAAGDGSSIYNSMLFTVVDGEMVLVTFNCLQEQLEEWQATGDEIIQSFKIS